MPGLLRAGRRLRPGRRTNERRAPRRPLRRQRPEGLVVVRAHRRLVHPRHALRPGVAAPRGPHVHGRRHALAGRRGAADPAHHGRRGLQRDLLRERRGARRERPRRDRQRLGGRDDDAPARARHARLRAHRHARGLRPQADRAREAARHRRLPPPRHGRARVDRAPGPQAHELPRADEARRDGHPRAPRARSRSSTGRSRTSG